MLATLAGNGILGTLAAGRVAVAAGLTTIFSDTYTDANGTLMSAHSAELGGTYTFAAGQGQAEIQSNTFQRKSPGAGYGSSGWARNNTALTSTPAEITIDVLVSSDNAYQHLFNFRLSRNVDGYPGTSGEYSFMVYWYQGVWYLTQWIGGVSNTVRGSAAGTTGAHAQKITDDGATIRVYIDAVEIMSYASADYYGNRYFCENIYWDNATGTTPYFDTILVQA